MATPNIPKGATPAQAGEAMGKSAAVMGDDFFKRVEELGLSAPKPNPPESIPVGTSFHPAEDDAED